MMDHDYGQPPVPTITGDIETPPTKAGDTFQTGYVNTHIATSQKRKVDEKAEVAKGKERDYPNVIEFERNRTAVCYKSMLPFSPPFRYQAYLKSIIDSLYEKLEKMLSEYVSKAYRPDTSKLKQYLQAISADGRFELLKKKYGLGTTALHKAAERGDTEVMRCLLELVEPQKRYELLQIQGWWRGGTPLHRAASRGRTEVMRCMLELVEPENLIQLLDIPNKSNMTALYVAKGEKTVQLIRQYREIAVERKLRLLKAAIDYLEAKIFIQQLRAIARDHVKVVSAVAPDNQSSSLSIQQESDKMSPREYLSYVCNDLSLEERQSLMSDERLRSETFLVNWPHDGNLSGVKMAQAGFYCVDDYDRVQCAFCRGSLHKWEAEDNPMTEHAKLFPFCRFVKGLECGNKEYKNDLLLADELKNFTLLTMPMVDGLQPGRMDAADSGPPPASCKTCYNMTSQVVQASQVGQPCGYLIYYGKCIQDEKLKMDRRNGYKCRCYDRMKTGSPSIPPGSNINTYKAGLHGHLQTTSLVPDNLKWIINPSLYGISSAVPPPPSYLTDVLCYPAGHHGAAVPDQLSVALQLQLAAMSPQQYRAAVRNDLSPIQRFWLMSFEMQRRRTFLDDWPHSGNLSGEQMAQSGLYHSGGYDSVRCVFCGVVLDKWEVGDDPMTEHKRWSTGCVFMAGWDCTIMGQQPSEDALPLEEETAR